MLKKTLVTMVFIIMTFSLFSLSGCDERIIYNSYTGEFGEYKPIELVMYGGETYTINADVFQELKIDFNKFNLDVDLYDDKNIVEINKNVITATNSGYVSIVASLYEKKTFNYSGQKCRYAYRVTAAKIYVFNEETATPIATAQELADMKNNTAGHYILKADIDLADWGDWEAIGKYKFNSDTEKGFSGMFVNPYGYKIKNLTVINSTAQAGLFDYLFSHSLIDGVILENVFIDVSDYDWDSIIYATVGSIAAYSRGAKILNCIVDGTISGGRYYTGGIVGSNMGDIINCDFSGTIKMNKEYSTSSYYDAVGGIAGVHSGDEDGIINCTVNAYIDGGERAIAGGIIGYDNYSIVALKSGSFTGSLIGRCTGTFVGCYWYTEESIDF